ncbi:golgin-45 [Parasteatoda tepidariorum]|uniref:golgin-45 n=1 Tax=Parasteatoda tepidariorum TaxID=114398 RepID=UPI001C71AFF3|nr:golgin-45 [Parasteatoda tepidariorum]
MSNIKKIPVPGRSAGDGMENCSPNSEFKTKNWANNHKQVSFISSIPSPGKLKEPKFIPYEPYKAAVLPIVPSSTMKDNHNASKLVIDSQKVSALASSIIELYSNVENKDISSNLSENQKCTMDCHVKLKALEEKIKLLEKENKELNAQYQVQTEVNADLKKMLVASLGEDVQCKVQYMTQDKVHLGKEVLQLSDELEQSKEEVEKLSALCNVWESKFKASSLMVKELAQWKASLSHKLNDSIAALDSMLREHDILFKQLHTTHIILEQTLDAFDPSAKQTYKNHDQSLSVLELAVELKSLSSKIQERLIGKQIFDNKSTVSGLRQFTNAELLVYDLFSNFERLSSKDVPFNKNTIKDAGLTACHVLPHQCANDANVRYCKHCSGEVEII